MKKAGVTSYGMRKANTKMLVDFIDEDEHIGGVIYGRKGNKLIESESVMLVATDKRLIYLNYEPISRYTDAIAYDVVAGVKKSSAGLFATVTLLTRMLDTSYTVKFVNQNCARQFVKYIDQRRLRQDGGDDTANKQNSTKKNIFNSKNENYSGALRYLKSHETAVFSTIDSNGNVSGAVIYYLVGEDNNIYILSKSHTKKAQNILINSHVALTVYEPNGLQTVQLQGDGSIEKDEKTRSQVFDKIVKNRYYSEKIDLPPITKIKEGTYMVIRVTPTTIKFRDYSKS